MLLAAPHLILPPEKPAFVRAHDLKGLPSWEEMERRRKAMFPFPFVVPGGNATITFGSFSSDTSDTSAYSIGGMTIGTAVANRYVLAGIFGIGTGATTLSSCTIGGISATRALEVTNSTVDIAFYIANVPTGTTATVAPTFSGTKSRCAAITWYAYGLRSPTPTATANDTSATGNTVNSTIDVQANGFAVAIAADNIATAGLTWVGLTEDADSTVETVPFSGASQNFSAAQTALAVSATFGAAPSIPALAIAAFR